MRACFNLVKLGPLKRCADMHMHTLPPPALPCAHTRSLSDIHACECACVHKNWLIFPYLHAMQVFKLLLVAFMQPLIVESGISFSVMLMVTLNTDFPWVSCSGFQNSVKVWSHPENLTAPKGFLLIWRTWWDTLCLTSGSCAWIFFLWMLTGWGEEGPSDLTLSWPGHAAKDGPTKEKARARHTLPQGQFEAGAYFGYSDTLWRRILSVDYVGWLGRLDWVACLNLEKEILVNKIFSLLVIWASLERLRPDIL